MNSSVYNAANIPFGSPFYKLYNSFLPGSPWYFLLLFNKWINPSDKDRLRRQYSNCDVLYFIHNFRLWWKIMTKNNIRFEWVKILNMECWLAPLWSVIYLVLLFYSWWPWWWVHSSPGLWVPAVIPHRRTQMLRTEGGYQIRPRIITHYLLWDILNTCNLRSIQKYFYLDLLYTTYTMYISNMIPISLQTPKLLCLPSLCLLALRWSAWCWLRSTLCLFWGRRGRRPTWWGGSGPEDDWGAICCPSAVLWVGGRGLICDDVIDTILPNERKTEQIM